MLAVVSLALALQVTIRVGSPDRSDSARKTRRDSIMTEIEQRTHDRQRRPVRRLPVTPELDKSAFRDPLARDLLMRARVARLQQDSSLESYEATSYERVSAGLGFRAIGRDRLLFRTEKASRVRWSRDGGAWVELKGRRTVSPAFDDDDDDMDLGDQSALPYYPGKEGLWIGAGKARSEVDEHELVHPIALGSEAYYRYASGDSLSITLPDGKKIRLQELRIEPRRPEWRLSVGSFWFEAETGQLVRAVYRLAVPLDIWAIADEEIKRDRAEAIAQGHKPDNDDAPPAWVKGLMSPLAATVEAVTVDYGLYGTHYWLPRAQYAEGWAKAGFIRVPFKIEQSFKYASVNDAQKIPPVPAPPQSVRDSLFGGDTTRWRDLSPDERNRRTRLMADVAKARRAERDAARADECARTGVHTTGWDRDRDGIRVAYQVPCDTTKLATAPELPASIFDPGDQIFGVHERDELLKSLDFSLQSSWAPQRPVVQYGLALTRYNRIEGFSTGVGATMQLGQGYSLDGRLRLGTGDWQPNAELGVARSNGRTTWRLGGLRRLAVASDWGPDPSFGGIGALLFGRDESFYYRTTGVELQRSSARGGGLSTRFFAEHDSPVSVTTTFNVAHALGGSSQFGPNFTAVRGNTLGMTVRDMRSFGLDPNGWRAFTQVLAEGGWFAPTDSSGHVFSRTAADVTVSRGLGKRLAAALTVAGGVTEHVPAQRYFFLGGTRTVRGQVAGTEVGDTYWLGRLELGTGSAGVRNVVFGDVGWAGPRAQWRTPGRPMSGVGIGTSFFDGLIRADLARGIYPAKKFRFDMYLEAKF